MSESKDIIIGGFLAIIVFLTGALYLVLQKNALENGKNNYLQMKGLYVFKQEEAKDKVTANLYLAENGMFYYQINTDETSKKVGNYIIVNDEIYLNFLFDIEDEPVISSTNENYILKIKNTESLWDSKPFITSLEPMLLEKTTIQEMNDFLESNDIAPFLAKYHLK